MCDIKPPRLIRKHDTDILNLRAEFAKVLSWLMIHWDYELPSGHMALVIAKRLVNNDRYVL